MWTKFLNKWNSENDSKKFLFRGAVMLWSGVGILFTFLPMNVLILTIGAMLAIAGTFTILIGLNS